MMDLFKKTMLTGIGLAAISRDKLEDLTRELIDKGNMTEEEGRKFVAEMFEYGEKAMDGLEKQVNTYVEKALNRMELVRKSELEELIVRDLVRKSELEELRAAVLELQTRLEEKQP